MWLVDQIDYPPVKQESLVEACWGDWWGYNSIQFYSVWCIK